MSIRRIALTALLKITEEGAYANLCLKQAAEGLSERDAKWLYASVYGTLDHLLYIDHVLAHFAKGKQKPMIRGILRMGAHALLFMRTPVAVTCNESVALAKEAGKGALSGFVNGVLRTIARNKDTLPSLPETTAERLSIQYSWPLWLVEEWVQRFGKSETEELLSAMEEDKGISLRPQPPYTLREMENAMEERGYECTSGRLLSDCLYIRGGMDVAREPLFIKGEITVQGEGAMAACRAAGVAPGMRVLDACAAPGGKSAYLYALGEQSISLYAFELHPHRLQLLQNTLKRLHVEAEIVLQDSAVDSPEFHEYFDIVFLDVPCSGLGTAGSKPDIRYSKMKETIDALVETQKKILDTCAKYVRPGGILLYASCTISYRENEEQINSFLVRNEAFCHAEFPKELANAIRPKQSGMAQLLPNLDGTEGFFIARMRRV